MKTYIGTKIVNAEPMTRIAYNTLRGWELPSDEIGNEAGYLVEYNDGVPNLARHGYTGYVSWSPAEQFEKAYRETYGMNFGLAIEAMRTGARVARVEWSSRGMWLKLVPAHSWCCTASGFFDSMDAAPYAYDTLPWVGMKTADNGFVPWLASQTDMLAYDWYIVD